MSQNLQQNRSIVENVFNKVYDKYDLMNDLMSFGIHRSWKKKLIITMNPTENQNLIDVGCGTGDIGKLYSDFTNHNSNILSTDPNEKMVEKGKSNLKNYKNIEWKICAGEKLDAMSDSFDFYTISFGLRNTKDVRKTINEAYRLLKKGGRFICLEFSKIDNSDLNFLYKQYSRIIPLIGKYIVGDRDPYEYLIKSIDQFLNQEELLNIMKECNFENCTYTNLNGGIVAIHSGWKI